MSKKTLLQKNRAKHEPELEEFKNFLGPLAKEYTDPQLRQLRYELYAMTELLLDLYEIKRAKTRNGRNAESASL